MVRSLLFALGGTGAVGPTVQGSAGDGMRASRARAEEMFQSPPTSGTPIEEALATAIRLDGTIPEPEAQVEVRLDDGSLLTIPDFAYSDLRIASFCDGFKDHGNVETLSEDARKRNRLQAMGWLVLTFWGRQILRDPARCVDEVRVAWKHRASQRARATGS
jgi:G:T-mismatch repair DNA endonuclease (very short patch repair protein)